MQGHPPLYVTAEQPENHWKIRKYYGWFQNFVCSTIIGKSMFDVSIAIKYVSPWSSGAVKIYKEPIYCASGKSDIVSI